MDKNLHELIMKLGENSDSTGNSTYKKNDIEPVEFKIWERDSNGVLVSRPVRRVQYMDSNVNPSPNQSEPIVTELGGSKAGSSVSNKSNCDNKVKAIHDFIMSNGRLV
jgi:hypothetical protein